MLILSRKVGERIVIGDGIEVVVQRVAGERVTLGVAAPRDIKILRGELEDFRNQPYKPVPAEATHHANNQVAPAVGSFARRSQLPR